jgi:hypothetical protein
MESSTLFPIGAEPHPLATIERAVANARPVTHVRNEFMQTSRRLYTPSDVSGGVRSRGIFDIF